MGTNSHHHHHHHHHQNNNSNQFHIKKLITGPIYCLIPLLLLHFYFFPIPSYNPSPVLTNQSHQKKIIPFPIHTPISISHTPPTPEEKSKKQKQHVKQQQQKCDFFDGSWVPDEQGPLYNDTTCGTIKEGQNCLAHGKPDTGYLNWRWRPAQCQLPRFNPHKCLELISNKHIAFVGDSLARNQLESLLCLLSAGSPPRLVYQDGEEKKFRRWVFDSHNATVSVFWSPFLVKGIEKNITTGQNYNMLFVDTADDRWVSQLNYINVIVFSVGHWFLHDAVYYENGEVIGCHHCPPGINHTETAFFGAFRKAVRTALREVVRKGKPESVVLTTFSPAHFEGEWDKAGACPKKEPYKKGEKELEYMDSEMNKIELEEVAAAAKAAAEVAPEMKIEALNITKLALMRPDGHPGPYMYANPFADGPKERVQNDCVHWCLPGPIDTWNAILLEMMKR